MLRSTKTGDSKSSWKVEKNIYFSYSQKVDLGVGDWVGGLLGLLSSINPLHVEMMPEAQVFFLQKSQESSKTLYVCKYTRLIELHLRE